MPMTDLLALDAVSVAYGKRRALDGVSLTVGPGEIVTLLGANGSGKSTTLRTISGLVRSHAGRIVFEGRDITRAAPDAIVAAGVGHVPEGREIFPQFTVHENLLVGGHTVARGDVAGATERAFALFPVLRERHQQIAGSLSGGEQQMLAIARALMSNPRVLLMDEPSEGLAPQIVAEVMSTIRRLKEQGLSIVLVEQNAKLVFDVADDIVILNSGQVAVEGGAAELQQRGLDLHQLLGIY